MYQRVRYRVLPDMARYCFMIKYTPEGAKAAQSDGYATRQAINEAAFAALGGRLEVWWWALQGDWDIIGIAELPSGSLAAIKALVDRSGTFTRSSIIELADSVTMDAAVAAGTSYRAPGQ